MKIKKQEAYILVKALKEGRPINQEELDQLVSFFDVTSKVSLKKLAKTNPWEWLKLAIDVDSRMSNDIICKDGFMFATDGRIVISIESDQDDGQYNTKHNELIRIGDINEKNENIAEQVRNMIQVDSNVVWKQANLLEAEVVSESIKIKRKYQSKVVYVHIDDDIFDRNYIQSAVAGIGEDYEYVILGESDVLHIRNKTKNCLVCSMAKPDN